MRVRPTFEGAVIRDPHTRTPLPAAGAEVPDTSFWHRRLRSGDVELVGDPAPAVPAKSSSKPVKE